MFKTTVSGYTRKLLDIQQREGQPNLVRAAIIDTLEDIRKEHTPQVHTVYAGQASASIHLSTSLQEAANVQAPSH